MNTGLNGKDLYLLRKMLKSCICSFEIDLSCIKNQIEIQTKEREKMKTIMPEKTWAAVRGLMCDSFTFYEIKTITGEAGLPINKLSHLQQKARGGASKGQLLDEIDELYNKLTTTNKHIFLIKLIEILLSRRPEKKNRINNVLKVVGWGVSKGTPYPLELQIDIELTKLPEGIQSELEKSIRRYRDGDSSGAITSICGAIDMLTENIYSKSNIGDHKSASYSERIGKSIKTKENEYKIVLTSFGISVSDSNLIWNNHSKSISQAGYVLGAFRREFSDVHGTKKLTTSISQKALNNAVFIIRSLL